MTKPFISVYEPVEISIDGATYPLKRRNRTVMRQLAAIQKRAAESADDEEKINVGYEQAALLIDAPQDVIDNLDSNQLRAILHWISAGLSDKPGQDDEKNVTRPGDEAPAG